MSKRDRLNQMIIHYTGGNKSQFARLVGISAQGLSSWINRDTYDIEAIYAKCVDINPSWLIAGEGSMLKSTSKQKINSVDTNTFLSFIKEKEEVIRVQAEEIGRLKAMVEQLSLEKEEAISAAKSARASITA